MPDTVIQQSFLYGVAERLFSTKHDIEKQKQCIKSAEKEAENWLNPIYFDALKLLIQMFKFPSIAFSKNELWEMIKPKPVIDYNLNEPTTIAYASYLRALILSERQQLRAN